MALKKVHFQIFRIYVFLLFCTFFSKRFHVLIWPLTQNLRLHLKKKVFPELFFYFFCKARKCLETCVNCAWNCATPLFTPTEVKLKKNIFLKTYSSLIWNAKIVPKVKFERYQEEESLIWKIRGLMNCNFAQL